MALGKARRVTKTVSFPDDLIARIEARARADGHFNFSAIVVAAAEMYLALPGTAEADQEPSAGAVACLAAPAATAKQERVA